MSEKIVLIFSGQGGNDAIRGLMVEFGDALISIGMSVVHVNFDPAELQMAADYIADGKVAFGLTYLGVGQDLVVSTSPGQPGKNLWETFRTPFLKIHGDIPAYFADRHGDTPATAVNLYVAREFLDFRRHWLPGSETMAAVVPPMPLFEQDLSSVDPVLRQGGKLVFVKNGNSPSGLRRLWNERLSKSISQLLADMADAARTPGLRSGVFSIGEFVAKFLSDRGVEPLSSISLVRFFSAQIDDYLRRLKSELIATAIIDLPVIVQGENWDHVDFSGKRAQLVPGQTYSATRRVFTDALGIIDMSPNTQGAPHERIWRAAGCYTLALTNRQEWMEQSFPEFSSLSFEFDVGSIRERVMDVLESPKRYLDTATAFGEAFRQIYPRSGFANSVVDYAELAMLRYSTAKPSIQPFFIWPMQDKGSA